MIYELIFGRTLEAFEQACIKEITTVELTAADEKFQVKGTVILSPGWRDVLNMDEDEGSEKEKKDFTLPQLSEGEMLPIQKLELLEKQTKAKPLLNDSSLLQMMKNCGRELEDEQIKEAMKEGGLGTPATRASTIKTLFTRGYVENKGKSIIPTKKGLVIYEAIKDEKIANPALTGTWEQKLSDMEAGKIEVDIFMAAIGAYTQEVTSRLIQVGESLKDHPSSQKA